MRSREIVVFLLLGSNHLANVQSLQSIYRQSYDNTILVAINDCCESFQSERFLNNLEDKPHRGVQKIIFSENAYPQGDALIKRIYLEKIAGEYLITLHAGDTFAHTDALEKAAERLDNNEDMAAVVAGVCSIEEWLDKGKNIDSCNVLFRISDWIEYDQRAEHKDRYSALEAMGEDNRLLFCETAICCAARLDCFRHPDFEHVDLSTARFCKMRAERKAEMSKPRRERIEAILHKVTHIRWIAAYFVIWLVFTLLFSLLSWLKAPELMIYAVKTLALLSGVFALSMFVLKVLRRLRREGLL